MNLELLKAHALKRMDTERDGAEKFKKVGVRHFDSWASPFLTVGVRFKCARPKWGMLRAFAPLPDVPALVLVKTIQPVICSVPEAGVR